MERRQPLEAAQGSRTISPPLPEVPGPTDTLILVQDNHVGFLKERTIW